MELPLGDAPRAHLEVMRPGAAGKIVLVPPGAAGVGVGPGAALSPEREGPPVRSHE